MTQHVVFLLSLCLPLLLLLPLRISAQEQPYQVAIEQSLAEADLLSAEALSRWTATASLFVGVNDALASTAGNMTVIYNQTSASADAFLNATFSNGDCPVAAAADFIANETKTLEYLCCHTQKLRSPGLLTTYAQMCTTYLPGCTGSEDPTALLLDYIRQITNIATVGIIGRVCLDDQTIIRAQAPIALAIASAPAAGILLETYQSLIFNVATLFTCVDGLSPRCAVNGTLTTAQAEPPDLDFPDVGFDLVCGSDVLAAFDLSRFTTLCQPPSPGF